MRGAGQRMAAVLAAVTTCGALTAWGPANARSAPDPPPGGSVVTVKTGGDHTGPDTAGPLAATVLGLYADPADPQPAGPWATCVSDADGDCSFLVPGTGDVNEGARFWVKQISAPNGRYTDPEPRTGPGSGSSSTATPYLFRTPPLAEGRTYTSQLDFAISDAKVPDASSGADVTVTETRHPGHTLVTPGGAPTPLAWGAPQEGYEVGQSVTIDEDVEVTDGRCRLTGRGVTEDGGRPDAGDLPHTAVLHRPHSAYTVTNTVTCEGGDWTVSKRSDPPSGTPVEPGDVITYRIEVRPQGRPARNVVVTDALSGGTPEGEAAATAGTVRSGEDGLTWRIPLLTRAQTLTYTVRAGDLGRKHGHATAGGPTPAPGSGPVGPTPAPGSGPGGVTPAPGSGPGGVTPAPGSGPVGPTPAPGGAAEGDEALDEADADDAVAGVVVGVVVGAVVNVVTPGRHGHCDGRCATRHPLVVPGPEEAGWAWGPGGPGWPGWPPGPAGPGPAAPTLPFTGAPVETALRWSAALVAAGLLLLALARRLRRPLLGPRQPRFPGLPRFPR
ncbi:DUF11 domain-containing protein [Nonomuraea pusilla]|uniref:Conserved repeat domain-containing protein n=1 Tax=Nonomuraea pusilla TaxID=46177 RepID=A0A1H7UD84_9ACTN|nr:DUF11 domain-containing protein [Nonomuraea pusilla]SEL94714.1 conserved repeat domain-containing protein [Nonomuraea pusilla]